jgi:hypothetical protein
LDKIIAENFNARCEEALPLAMKPRACLNLNLDPDLALDLTDQDQEQDRSMRPSKA